MVAYFIPSLLADAADDSVMQIGFQDAIREDNDCAEDENKT
jgi:hypothetical protein